MHKKFILALRILLGLLLLTAGLNKFLHFIEMPEMSAPAGQFMEALVETGYMIPLIGITEILVGVLLLANLLVPVALLLLAPLTINILLFHLFLDPATVFPGLVVALLNLYLLIAHRKYYQSLLRAD
jgi:putative oxidoreductase